MSHRRMWVILIVALVVRGAILLAGAGDVKGRFFTPDSHDYDSLARGMIERGEFTRSPDAPPELFRAPGYPAFLAAVYFLSGGSMLAALAVQVLLDVALCYLVYRLGLRLCSRGVAVLAAAIQAVSPVAVVASVRLLSDSLSALMLTGAVLLLVDYFQRDRKWAVVAAGLLMGAGCLVRPVFQPFALLAMAVVLIARWRRPQWALIFVGCVALCTAPWIARNAAATGYRQLSGVGDYNLFYYNALALHRQDPQMPLTPSQRAMVDRPERSPANWPQAAGINDPDFLLTCRREGLAVIGKNLLRYAWVHLRTTGYVFGPAASDVLEVCGITKGGKGTLAVLQTRGPVAAVRHYFGGQAWPLVLFVPLAMFALAKCAGEAVGAVRHVRARMGPAKWLVLAAILYFALAPGPVANARFRVPIAPLLSIAAAAGWAFLANAVSRRRLVAFDPPS